MTSIRPDRREPARDRSRCAQRFHAGGAELFDQDDITEGEGARFMVKLLCR